MYILNQFGSLDVSDADGLTEINFRFSDKILDKLNEKHSVSQKEVIQCFYNSNDDDYLEDGREEHKTIPPTQWFLAYTDSGRLLKVVFVFSENKNTFYVKTAYEPNQSVIDMFNQVNGTNF